MCSRASGSWSNEKLSGMPSIPHGLATGSNPTDQKFAGILLEVGASVRVAQHGKVAWQLWDRLCDDVEVFRRVQRHRRPSFRTEFVRPHASAIHHDLSLDFVEGPSNADGFAVFDDDLIDLDVFDDPCAAAPC